MSYRDILVERQDGIVLVTLNKPDKLNAMTWDSWAEVEDALAQADRNDEDKVVVFTGAGRGFCSGTDLTADQTSTDTPKGEPSRRQKLRSRYLVTSSVIGCAKPTIAAVNGAAAGAGFSLALACDIRIASEQARFAAIWSRRALVPDLGCSYLLPRIVGTAKALEMMYTGDIIDAQEALGIGLVSRVVPHQELMPAVMELAGRIARGPSIAIELTKRLAYRDQMEALAAQTEYEEHLQSICNQTEDVQEGRRSFIERREPNFKGR